MTSPDSLYHIGYQVGGDGVVPHSLSCAKIVTETTSDHHKFQVGIKKRCNEEHSKNPVPPLWNMHGFMMATKSTSKYSRLGSKYV